jgi:hypothetical protein
LHWGGDYLPLITGLTGAGAAWAMGGDPMNGFMQGFGIGALNHKGEIFITDDGTYGELSCADAVIWGQRMPMFVERNGMFYAWTPAIGGYHTLVGERGLQNVYPEFDILCIGRGLYNATAGSVHNIVGNEGANVFKHSYKYADRVRMRALQDPVSHNFPYSFDDAILSTSPALKSNGYKIFQQQGIMNGKSGAFEIGVTKSGVIDHRFFRPL